MNSTVKHFKTSINLLIELLKQKKLKNLLLLNKCFYINKGSDDVDDK